MKIYNVNSQSHSPLQQDNRHHPDSQIQADVIAQTETITFPSTEGWTSFLAIRHSSTE